MKRKKLLETFSFILFVISLLIVYLWIYIFPSVKKVNRLKRDIKEYNLRIKTAYTEKSVFIFGDERESLLFRDAEREFSGRLISEDKENDPILRKVMKKIGEKAGIRGLKITTGEDDADTVNPVFPASRFGRVKSERIDMSFSAGFRYGAEFIRLFPGPGYFFIINSISAERSGIYYKFNVISERLSLKDNDPGGESFIHKGSEIIDMDSPLLKRPVYLSSVKLEKKHSTNNGEKN